MLSVPTVFFCCLIILAKLTNLSVFLKNNPRSLAIPLLP